MGKARISVFIAGVLVLASAGIAVQFYTKCRRVEDERALDARRIRELEAQLRLVQAEVSEYQEKLRGAERLADEIERERDAEADLARQHAARIEQLESELAALAQPPPPTQPTVAVLIEDQPAVASEVGASAEIASSPADSTLPQRDAEPSKGELERELEEVRAEKRQLEIQHAALVGDKAGGVPLGTVRVRTGLRLKGKVLVINQRYSFVVIDLGARDGVEKGMVLILHRGRKFIGKCQVTKVHNDKVAADLVLDWMKDQVLVGDGVRKF